MNMSRLCLLCLIPSLMFGAAARAQDMAELDLATLMSMDVMVTSAAKREQASSDAPAAVYVITRDDIRRSGATALPEVLRMAPGVQVSRINTRSWAVTVRGFSGRFASKLLVMIDGRSIYTPLFSGVIWEEHSVFLDEIDRIEVIRGPGGALWGINAVNGVINIITRKASDSAGLRVSAGSGSLHNRAGALSYGGSAEIVGDYRFYVDHGEVDSFEAGSEPWTHTQAGWRLDRALLDGAFTFQGDINKADFGSLADPTVAELAMSAQLGNVSASWQHDASPGQLELRSYYSWAERGAPGRWDDSAFGFDGQFSAKRIGRHLLTSGAGYRYIVDEMKDPVPGHTFSRPKLHQHQWSVYGQDEVHFLDDDVRLTLGAKLEDMKFTGLAFQPTIRGLWRVTDSHTAWVAASRAVRTPSRVELHTRMDLGGNAPNGFIVRLLGNDALEAEDLRAYELGWRWRPYQALSFDAAFYRNQYERLIGGEQLPPEFEFVPQPRLVLPSKFANIENTRVDGAELVVEWAANNWLRLQGQGTWQDSDADLVGFLPGPIDPARMFAVRAQLDLPKQVELDLTWRSVSDMVGLGLEGYQGLDARAAWQPLASIELSLSIENVFDDERIESNDDLALLPGVTMGRSVFARVLWQPGR